MTKKKKAVSYIKWRINNGTYKPGEKVPSENALAIRVNCSRVTARSALQELKYQGLIIPRKGIGYYVSEDRKKKTFPILSKKKKTKIEYSKIKPKLDKLGQKNFAFLKLNIEEFEKNFKFGFTKVMYGDEVPFSLLISFLNTKKIKKINENKIKKSLSCFLTHSDINIVERKEITFIEEANKNIAQNLKIEKLSLVSATYSSMIDEDGEIIEYAIRYVIPKEFFIKKHIYY